MALDKHSPIPLYYQLVELIREQIRSGELMPGDQLPPERVLSERYRISRMTARQAIAYLTRDGSLLSEHGRGTFVAEPKLTYDAIHLLGFTEEVVQRGGKAVSRVLEQAVVEPPARVASGLALPSGGQAVKIARLRLSDATPLLLETTYVPWSLCPGLEHEDLAGHSLYGVLEQRYEVSMARASQQLEVTVANDYECDLFGIPVGTPMILLEGITFDERDQPVEYFKAIYRGDRWKFAYESERSRGEHAARPSRLSVVLA